MSRNKAYVFEVSNVNAEMCATALGIPMKDFEDAVLAVCARQFGAEYIVTGDQDFIAFEESPVMAISVNDMLEIIS